MFWIGGIGVWTLATLMYSYLIALNKDVDHTISVYDLRFLSAMDMRYTIRVTVAPQVDVVVVSDLKLGIVVQLKVIHRKFAQ